MHDNSPRHTLPTVEGDDDANNNQEKEADDGEDDDDGQESALASKRCRVAGNNFTSSATQSKVESAGESTYCNTKQ